MPDHTEQLKTLIQDLINNRAEQAEMTMHDYFIAKTKEVAGMPPDEEPVPDPVPEEDEFEEE